MRRLGTMLPVIVVFLFISRSASPARATDFNLLDPSVEALDDGLQMQLTADGVVATLSTNGGNLNQDQGRFGIVTLQDVGDQNSLINDPEELFISFNVPVTWDSFSVSVQGNEECSVVVVADNGGQLFCGSGSQNSGAGQVVPVGAQVRLFASDSGGFSLDSFSVTSTGAGTGDGSGGDDGTTGPTNPILRVEHSGSGGGGAIARYLDTDQLIATYRTDDGERFFEVEVPFGAVVYLRDTSAGEGGCFLFTGFYYEDGRPLPFDGDNDRWPLVIEGDTTISADFAPRFFRCGTCGILPLGLTVVGLQLMQRRQRRAFRKRKTYSQVSRPTCR